MSNHAARIAASLRTEHVTAKIPWSSPPYVPKPNAGVPLESVARDARYSVLFETMNSVGAEAIAFGHHADDQVETFLMRIAKGTSTLGLGGMKAVRRFGMGGVVDGKMGWFGHLGMKRWIVRPLLSVSKDRILATCEANKLEYVTDSTNFQPQLTLRNTIRHALSKRRIDSEQYTPFHCDLKKMTDHAKTLGIPLDVSAGMEPLRGLVDHYAQAVATIQNQAQNHLTSCIRQSPPSSIVLSSDELARVTDPTIRLAMVTDILRYVSPYPWGSLRAESFRNSASLKLISSKLWSDQREKLRPFSAGAAVLWTPVAVNSKEEIKMASNFTCPDLSCGWLATRLPPYRNPGTADTVHIDLTLNHNRAIYNRTVTQLEQVLYDCRFLLTIDWTKFPEEISQLLARPNTHYKLLIVPYTRSYLPCIVLRSSNEDEPDVVLATPYYSVTLGSIPSKGGFGGASWVHWEFVRRISAN